MKQGLFYLSCLMVLMKGSACQMVSEQNSNQAMMKPISELTSVGSEDIATLLNQANKQAVFIT